VVLNEREGAGGVDVMTSCTAMLPTYIDEEQSKSKLSGGYQTSIVPKRLRDTTYFASILIITLMRPFGIWYLVFGIRF
jgi:hypothetical protein